MIVAVLVRPTALMAPLVMVRPLAVTDALLIRPIAVKAAAVVIAAVLAMMSLLQRDCHYWRHARQERKVSEMDVEKPHPERDPHCCGAAGAVKRV